MSVNDATYWYMRREVDKAVGSRLLRVVWMEGYVSTDDAIRDALHEEVADEWEE
jgi:hypothetical protein